MKRVILLTCLVFLVVFSGSVSAVTNVTGCGTLSIPGETYVLSNDINASGTCITIGADDITLDGNGHTITGSGVLGNDLGYGVYLPGRTGVTVKNLNIERFFSGIRLFSSRDNTITGNNASSDAILGSPLVNMYGIYLKSSSGNTISNNTVIANHWGIYLSNSSSNNIENNTANSNNQVGIILGYSSSNLLTDNTLNSNNFHGIEFYSSSDYNTVTNNIIKWNLRQGIILSSSNNNTLYNNLFNNPDNFGSAGSNYWNTTKQPGPNIVGGPYLGGNFWAKPDGTGFSDTCTDADRDGICDSNYTLTSGNVDYLPLSLNFVVHPPGRQHRHFNGNMGGNVNGNVNTNTNANYPGNVDTGGDQGGGNPLSRLWQWLRGSGR